MEVFDTFGDGKRDNCTPVEKKWGEIEKCLYYHYVPEQIMWVRTPKTLLFVEIEGFRKMLGGVEQMLILKHVREYFCQVGGVQISMFDNIFN